MKDKDFSLHSAEKHVRQIVRKNAESLLACDVTTREAEDEVMKFFPQLQLFADRFTAFNREQFSNIPNTRQLLEPALDHQPQVSFVACKVEAVEEPFVCHELGMKGNVDMVVQALTTPSHMAHFDRPKASIMGVELKTGHNQVTQTAHMAQLSMYTLMLQTRYGFTDVSDTHEVGATREGLLLYMNNEAVRAVHVNPVLQETKSLIGHRNFLATQIVRVMRRPEVRFEGKKPIVYVLYKLSQYALVILLTCRHFFLLPAVQLTLPRRRFLI